jgi:uncharacterized membrane protein YphA (DoxX/SURF4 family)
VPDGAQARSAAAGGDLRLQRGGHTAPSAEAKKVGDSLPEQVPTDPDTLVKLDAGVKLVAGLGLALGRFPRLSALVLAADLVPTTLAAHSFWELEDPTARAGQRTHFMKNLGLVGGLLIAAGHTKKKS